MFKARFIDFCEISKKFDKHQALDNVSFHVRENEIVALLGCNGAGKTTALNILTGFLKPDSGRVEILNKRIDTDLEQIRTQIGFLTSEMALYEKLSVKESIEFISSVRNLDKTFVKDRIKYFNEMFQLEKFYHKKYHELSSGQKQKSLITAAVLHDPKIMIFDEITASLDVVTCKNIMDFLKNEKDKGKAILFSTHILTEAEYLSDRIVIMDNGKVIEENTAEQMKNNYNVNNLFEAFFKSVNSQKDAA